MARIRSIKPEFWKSEAIARHDFFTRLVFVGLWSYVDDNGVGIDNYRLIAAELFPLEDDFAEVSRNLRESLARLADAGRIRRYTVDGKAYLAVVNWSEHQKIDRPNKARYPEPDDPRATPTTPPTSQDTPPPAPPRETLDEPSRGSRATPSSGTGEQGNREQIHMSAGADVPDGFDEFWDAVPRKDGKRPAQIAYAKAIKKPGVTPTLLLERVTAYASRMAKQGTPAEKIKMMQGWLNDERWNDEAAALPKQRAKFAWEN